MFFGEFKHIVWKYLNQTLVTALPSDQTIYLFVGYTTPRIGATMSEIYEKHRDLDGYLYIRYSVE